MLRFQIHTKQTCITKGSSVLSTVLVLISKFLGFHFKDKSPVDPILKAGGLLWKVSRMYRIFRVFYGFSVCLFVHHDDGWIGLGWG